jgi:hypothetical protein
MFPNFLLKGVPLKNILRTAGALFAVLLTSFTPPAQALLMISHMGHGGGHGGCSIETGPFPLGLSIYQLAESRKETMGPVEHPHCDHIPTPGRVRMSIDFSTYEPREMPLTLRLVRKDGASEKEIDQTPSKIYSSGIATMETRLDQVGEYEFQLDFASGGKMPATQFRLPIHVGDRDKHGFPWLGASIATALLLAAGGAFLWLKRQKPAGTA